MQAELWYLTVFVCKNRILNSCTVKDPSEAVFHNFVVEGQRNGKKLVVAGCVPQGGCLLVVRM